MLFSSADKLLSILRQVQRSRTLDWITLLLCPFSPSPLHYWCATEVAQTRWKTTVQSSDVRNSWSGSNEYPLLESNSDLLNYSNPTRKFLKNDRVSSRMYSSHFRKIAARLTIFCCPWYKTFPFWQKFYQRSSWKSCHFILFKFSCKQNTNPFSTC